MSHIGILIDFVSWNLGLITVKPSDIADLPLCCNKFLLEGQRHLKGYGLPPPALEASYLQPFSCTDKNLLRVKLPSPHVCYIIYLGASYTSDK
jgi:hypothetical protein